MPDVITCTSEGDDLRGRRCQGVSRPDDAPAVRRNGAGPVQGPPAVTGNPCASRMIPLESPVPEIGTPGSESGGRKRTHGSRPAARRESAGQATDPLPATRLPSTLLNAVKMHRPSRSLSLAHGAPPRPGKLCSWAVLISTAYGHKRKGNQPMPTPSFAIP